MLEMGDSTSPRHILLLLSGTDNQGRTGTQFQSGKSHTHPGHREQKAKIVPFGIQQLFTGAVPLK